MDDFASGGYRAVASPSISSDNDITTSTVDREDHEREQSEASIKPGKAKESREQFANKKNSDMADPFECRMRIIHMLQNLTASAVSQQKAAAFALKHKDLDEDLHSCILEQLERSSMNTRANIMFFIEQLLDMATKEGHDNYVKMIQRDIIRIVEAVAPEHRTGAANVGILRLVLQQLRAKGYLEAQTVTEIEEVLKEREATAEAAGLASPVKQEEFKEPPSLLIPKHPNRPSGPPIDKRQVEQRIEEDRERHKRAREEHWAIKSRQDEIDRLWEETSDLGEDDHIMGREEFLAREAAIAQQCPHYVPRTLDDLYGRNGKDD